MSRRDENTECKVYVGDLPRDAEEKEIERSFGHYGPLKSVWVARNPPGFAFAEFEDPRDAEDAVRGLDGTNICGSRVRVEHATGKVRPKPWQRNGRGGPEPSSRYGGGGGGGGGPPARRSNFDPNDRCYVCGERGHYSYDCPRSGRAGGGGGDSGSRRRRSPSRSRSRDRRRRSYSRSPSPRRSRDRSPKRSASRERSYD